MPVVTAQHAELLAVGSVRLRHVIEHRVARSTAPSEGRCEQVTASHGSGGCCSLFECGDLLRMTHHDVRQIVADLQQLGCASQGLWMPRDCRIALRAREGGVEKAQEISSRLDSKF